MAALQWLIALSDSPILTNSVKHFPVPSSQYSFIPAFAKPAERRRFSLNTEPKLKSLRLEAYLPKDPPICCKI